MEQDKSLFRLEVDPTTNTNLSEASKWAKFLAILGFCALGLLLLLMVVFGARLSYTISSMFSTGFGDLTAVFIIIFIVATAIIGTLCFFLLRGATRTRKGLQYNDQNAFAEGIAAFRNYFLMYGILSLLTLLNDIRDLF